MLNNEERIALLLENVRKLEEERVYAAKLLNEYARSGNGGACQCCGWYHDHRPECDIGKFIVKAHYHA